MDSVTEESVEKLLKDKGNKEVELDNVKKTTINKMWISELDQLRVQYIEYKEERARLMSGEEKKKKVVSKAGVVSKATVKKNVKKTNLMIVEDE
jgi:translation initiation factor IF-1